MITKRGEQRYLIRIFLGRNVTTGKRDWHTETFHGTKKAADARERQLQADFSQGSFAPKKSRMTLNELFTRWMETASHRLKARTVADYEKLWKGKVEPEVIGRIPLEKVTALAIQELYNRLLMKNLEASTKKLHSLLNQVLKQAVRWKLISHNPAADVDAPRYRPDQGVKSMDNATALAFVRALQNHPERVLFTLAIETGLRPGEYAGLQWNDVDFNKPALSIQRTLVRPKGGAWILEHPKTRSSERRVVISDALALLLKQHKADQDSQAKLAGERWSNPHGFVFTSQFGSPINTTNILKRKFKPLLAATGLSPTFHLYTLRHTIATLLMGSGEHPKVVSERLGHSDIKLTLNTYSHVLPTMQKGAAEKANQLLSPGAD